MRIFNSKTFNFVRTIFDKIVRKNTAYHGSPFNFNVFDVAKIGQGEGCGMRGKGIYLHEKKDFAPYYANLRSPDAPIHIGCTKPLKNPQPTIYKVKGIRKLNLKSVSEREAKNIARNQEKFCTDNPSIEGLKVTNGEIVVFPSAVNKLIIRKKYTIEKFVARNPHINFRPWTRNMA